MPIDYFDCRYFGCLMIRHFDSHDDYTYNITDNGSGFRMIIFRYPTYLLNNILYSTYRNLKYNLYTNLNKSTKIK